MGKPLVGVTGITEALIIWPHIYSSVSRVLYIQYTFFDICQGVAHVCHAAIATILVQNAKSLHHPHIIALSTHHVLLSKQAAPHTAVTSAYKFYYSHDS